MPTRSLVILAGDLVRLRAQVDLPDPHRMADLPERMPARCRRSRRSWPSMNSRPASCASTTACATMVPRRSSLSRCRLATRGSPAVSIRSTSTWVSVFQNARVVLGSTMCRGSPSNATIATSLGPGRTITKCRAARSGCVFSNSSARSAETRRGPPSGPRRLGGRRCRANGIGPARAGARSSRRASESRARRP